MYLNENWRNVFWMFGRIDKGLADAASTETPRGRRYALMVELYRERGVKGCGRSDSMSRHLQTMNYSVHAAPR